MPEPEVIVPRLPSGAPLSDIVTAEAHHAMSAALDQIVRRLTMPATPALHASLAGGRKTMGATLAVAMCLHARPQDRLTHVIVPAELENDPDYFFPMADGGASAIGPELTDILFPRLRPMLPEAARQLPLERLVPALESRLAETALVTVDLPRRSIRFPGGAVRLSPLLVAVYATLVSAGRDGSGEIRPLSLDLSVLASHYRRAGAAPEMVESLAVRLRTDDPRPWLREQIALIRNRLVKEAGHALAHDLGIEQVGRRPKTGYRLRLPPTRVRIVADDDVPRTPFGVDSMGKGP
jgi:hypothetical protein